MVVGIGRPREAQRIDRITGVRVRQRQVLREDQRGRRVDPVGRDDVAGERLSGQRVAERARVAGEVALTLGGRRHQRGQVGRALLLQRALVGAEEERPVLDDRAAERAAELLAVQAVVDAGREEVVGVHRRIAQVAEAEAAEIVGARAGDGVDDRAGVAPVLGAEGVGLDRELLQGVGIGHRVRAVAVVVVVRPAVHDVVGRIGARAVGRDAARAGIGRAGGHIGAGIGDHAGNQRHQLRGIAAVERQFLDPLLVDDGLQRARHRVHRRADAADRHRFGQVADAQRDVEADLFAHPDDDVLDLHRLEAGEFHLHGVAADRQTAQHVLAGLVRDGRQHRSGCRGGRLHRGARHHRAIAVTDHARESARRRLCLQAAGTSRATSSAISATRVIVLIIGSRPCAPHASAPRREGTRSGERAHPFLAC